MSIGRWLIAAVLLAPSASAWAQETCPERMEPDAFRDRLSQVAAAASSGGDTVGSRLDTLERVAVSCIDGPLSAGDLARLFLAQAVWNLSSELGDPMLGEKRMAWAAALGGSAEWMPVYDPFKAEFETGQAIASQKGTLELAFNPQPDVLVVDGQVEYEMGPREVVVGAHLVQWLSDSGWTGRLVVVEPGATGRLEIGAPASASGGPPGSDGPAGTIDSGKQRPEVVDQWAGGALFVQRYTAQVSDGLQVWEGSALAPGGQAEGRYAVLDWLSTGAQIRFAPEGDEANPGVLTRVAAEAGLGLGGFFRADLLVGVTMGGVPQASAAAAADAPPSFEESFTVGPRVRLRGAAGDQLRVALTAGGALLGEATELGGDLTAEWRMAPVSPLLRVSGGQLQQPGIEGIDDRYRWAGAEVGARWHF